MVPMRAMSDSDIVEVGHPVLRARAAEVSIEQLRGPDLQSLIDRMVQSMRDAKGVGVAAPQLGVGMQIVVLEDKEGLMGGLSARQRRERERAPFDLKVLVNPVIKHKSDDTAGFYEGCLSVPGYVALVDRAIEVEVEALDRNGEPFTWRPRGWPARIVQHEVDHLGGTLFVDRMKTRSLTTGDHYMSRWMKFPVSKARSELDVDRNPDD